MKRFLGATLLLAPLILLLLWINGAFSPKQSVYSDNGRHLVARVHDGAPGWGADHFVYLYLIGKSGEERVIWRDPNGQQNSRSAKSLMASIRWLGEKIIKFESEKVKLSYELHETPSGEWRESSEEIF